MVYLDFSFSLSRVLIAAIALGIAELTADSIPGLPGILPRFSPDLVCRTDVPRMTK